MQFSRLAEISEPWLDARLLSRKETTMIYTSLRPLNHKSRGTTLSYISEHRDSPSRTCGHVDRLNKSGRVTGYSRGSVLLDMPTLGCTTKDVDFEVLLHIY